MNTTVLVTLKHISCSHCSAIFGVISDAETELRRSHKTFYCPHCGGRQHFPHQSDIERAEAAAKRAQELLELERRMNANQRERADAAERRLSATRGVVTRIKNRVGAGVCPCCNRTFAALAKHMQTKHPDYRKADGEAS